MYLIKILSILIIKYPYNMNFELVNKTICLCAKRNSGKSQLIKYIVSLYGHLFNKIFVVCPSEAVNRFYGQFINPENIFNDYSES